MLRYFVIFALFLNGAIEKAAGDEWEIIVHREDTVVHEDANVFSTNTPISSEQPITFKKMISEGDIEAWCDLQPENRGDKRYRKEFGYDPCEEYDDGTWEDVMSQILRRGWFPDAKCPVQPGEYTIYEPIGPMTVEIKEEIMCDKYIAKSEMVYYGNGSKTISTSTYIIDIPKCNLVCK